TFRVTSLCLANLQGAESIPAYIDSDARRGYEFRVYQQLGELYIKQERTKDAADTFGLFARLHPLHAQAPQLQARVIEIYQQGGFANQALGTKTRVSPRRPSSMKRPLISTPRTRRAPMRATPRCSPMPRRRSARRLASSRRCSAPASRVRCASHRLSRPTCARAPCSRTRPR